jgi:hypothetical protein
MAERQEVSDADATHMMVIALAGKTAIHLKEFHGVEPSGNKHENAGLHVTAHGYRHDAMGPLWLPQLRRASGLPDES